MDSWAISLNLAWEGDFGTLTFITGIRSLEQKVHHRLFDGPGFAGTYTIANSGEHDQFTQEIKYNNTFMNDRVDFVGGVYYHSEDKLPTGLPFSILACRFCWLTGKWITTTHRLRFMVRLISRSPKR